MSPYSLPMNLWMLEFKSYSQPMNLRLHSHEFLFPANESLDAWVQVLFPANESLDAFP